MQLHTLPVFFALVGGVFQFGITGLVLGPVILSVAIGVLQVWKWRTADGRGAEKPQEPITVAHRNERLSRDDLLELRDV
jgi:predicted PurR-regulated permease PerM